MSSNALIKVENGFNAGGVIQIDPASKLSDVRVILQKKTPPLMLDNQFFIVDGSSLEKSDEPTTSLSEVIVKPASGSPVLTVGVGSIPIPGDTTWDALTIAAKTEVINKVAQLTKGLSLSENEGVFKTTQEALADFSATDNQWTSATPRIIASVTTNSYFSKYAKSLATSSTDGASLSVDTPVGGGEASFDHAKSQSQSASTVSTYSVGTYNLNKVLIDFDKSKYSLTQGFVQSLEAAMELPDKPSQFVGVVQALNKYGWYVPLTVSLGGVLLTTQDSQTTSWETAKSESLSFGASFKASFKGIGGGGAYKHSDTTRSTTSGSEGSDSLTFTAVGGNAADSNDFPKWAKSLESADKWNVSSYHTLIPSLYPLINMGGNNKAFLYAIKNLLADEYASCRDLQKLQPLINIGSYTQAINNLLPGF